MSYLLPEFVAPNFVKFKIPHSSFFLSPWSPAFSFQYAAPVAAQAQPAVPQAIQNATQAQKVQQKETVRSFLNEYFWIQIKFVREN